MAATPISFDTVKKHVVSILQASQTAYGSGTTGNAPDGSKAQFSSSEEINNTILEKDGEVCTLICNTFGHPYQVQFETTTAPQTMNANGLALPNGNGMVTRIQCSNGGLNKTFVAADVNTTSDTIAIANHGFATGQKVQLSNSGGGLPAPLTASTDYYIIRLTDSVLRLATTFANATATLPVQIDLTTTGTGTQTIETQFSTGIEAMSRDEIAEVNNNPNVYGRLPYYTAGYWKIVGNSAFSTSAYIKFTYTSFTQSSAPQAPEPYMWAVVAGTIASLLKDGGDDAQCGYYLQMYQQMLQAIAARESVIPPISAYQSI